MKTDRPHWQIQARHDYEYSGDSIGAIAERYGRHRTTLKKAMLRDDGMGDPWTRKAPANNKGGRARLDDLEVISPTHLSIGARLNYYRSVQNEMSCTELGNILNVNRYTEKKMELGRHEFTLSQLITIAGLLKITVQELLTPASASRVNSTVTTEAPLNAH